MKIDFDAYDFLELARSMCAEQDGCEDCPAYSERRCQFLPCADDMSSQELIDNVALWKAKKERKARG